MFIFLDHLHKLLQTKILSNSAICFKVVEQIIKNRKNETNSNCVEVAVELFDNSISEIVTIISEKFHLKY